MSKMDYWFWAEKKESDSFLEVCRLFFHFDKFLSKLTGFLVNRSPHNYWLQFLLILLMEKEEA